MVKKLPLKETAISRKLIELIAGQSKVNFSLGTLLLGVQIEMLSTYLIY